MSSKDHSEFKDINPLISFIRQCGRPEGMVIITSLAVIQYWLISLLGGGSYKDVSSHFDLGTFPIAVMSLIIGFLLMTGTFYYVESMTNMLKVQVYNYLKIPVLFFSVIFIFMMSASFLQESGFSNVGYLFPRYGEITDVLYYSLTYIGMLATAIVISFIQKKELPLGIIIFILCIHSAIIFYASVYQDAKNNSYINDAKYCYWLYLVADSQPHVTKKPDPTCLRIGITTRSKPLHLID